MYRLCVNDLKERMMITKRENSEKETSENSRIRANIILKRILCISCIAVSMIMLIACSDKKEPVVVNEENIEGIIKSLVESNSFENPIDQVMKELVAAEYKLGEGEEIVETYMSIGALAEEVTFIKSNDAKATKEKALEYVNSRKESYESYNPAEAEKLKSAIVEICGEYVVVCVANDYSEIKNILYK